MTKKIHYPFIISLIAHLLLILNVAFVWTFKPAEVKPLMYLPAYLAKPVNSGPTEKAFVKQSPSPQSTPQQMSTPQTQQTQKEKNAPTSQSGIEKPASQKAIAISQPKAQPNQQKSVKQAKSESRPERQDTQDFSKQKSVSRPLLKLLHDATAERLVYPKIAADFNQSGTVAVGFTVHPNGQITGARVVKSSGFDMLDSAALEAINQISPVNGVDQYIQKDEFVTAYIVFKLMGGNGSFAFDM